MPTDWPENLATIDEKIRQGQAASARDTLRRLTRGRIPREFAAELAMLAWRSGIPELGVRLLNPIVRPRAKTIAHPSDWEITQYAACLNRIGASEEARALLAKVDHEKIPQALLYEAFTSFAEWRYDIAIPRLEKYLETAKLDDYQRLVGEINLAAALTHERRSREATPLLEKLFEEARVGEHRLLLANAAELRAENAILEKRWEDADRYLSDAEAAANGGELHLLFLRKWRAVLECLRSGGSEQNLARLRAVRDEAKQMDHWETVRSCEGWEAVCSHREDLLLRVWFGTPFEGLRRGWQSDFGRPLSVPKEYLWNISPGDGPVIDLFGPKKTDSPLKRGQLLHRLLTVLVSDFYRPFRVAALHYRLYPGYLFNTLHSPARIHEAVRRLRTWFDESEIPLDVEEKEGTYRLSAKQPCSLLLNLPLLQTTRHEELLGRLRASWPQSPFDVDEASRILNLSRSSARRLFDEARTRGELTRSGRGPATKYRFTG